MIIFYFIILQKIGKNIHISNKKSHVISVSSFLSSCLIYLSNIIPPQLVNFEKETSRILAKKTMAETIGHSPLFQMNFL